MTARKSMWVALFVAAIVMVGLLARRSVTSNAITSVRLVGDQFFYLQAPGKSKQTILMVRKPSDPAGRQLLDPSSLAPAGKTAAIFDIEPSWNGKYVAVGLRPDGSSPRSVIRVVQVSNGELLPDSIPRTVDGAASWTDDDGSFYYRAFQKMPAGSPASALFDNMRAYVHKSGDEAALDQPVFGSDVTPELHLPRSGFTNAFPVAQTTLELAVQSSEPSELDAFWVRDKSDKEPRWRQVADHKDQVLFEFATRRSQFYYVTTANAQNGRVMVFDLSKEDVSNAKEILPQSDLDLSDRDACGIVGAQDALYVYGLRKGASVVTRISYDNPTQPEEIPMPVVGKLSDVSGDYRAPGFVFTLSRKFRRSAFYRYDPAKRISEQVQLH